MFGQENTLDKNCLQMRVGVSYLVDTTIGKSDGRGVEGSTSSLGTSWLGKHYLGTVRDEEWDVAMGIRNNSHPADILRVGSFYSVPLKIASFGFNPHVQPLW